MGFGTLFTLKNCLGVIFKELKVQREQMGKLIERDTWSFALWQVSTQVIVEIIYMLIEYLKYFIIIIKQQTAKQCCSERALEGPGLWSVGDGEEHKNTEVNHGQKEGQ